MDSTLDSYTNYSETFESGLIMDFEIVKEKVEVDFANEIAQKEDCNIHLESSGLF